MVTHGGKLKNLALSLTVVASAICGTQSASAADPQYFTASYQANLPVGEPVRDSLASASDANQAPEAWIDDAIIYGLAPTYISPNEGKKLDDIRSQLPEMKSLGVNTVWLQPIYKSHAREQGYDVTDYFKIAPDLGDEADLHELIQAAHKLKMKVVFDFVPNHLSAHHPYVRDIAQRGTDSPYYSMFMHSKSEAPYSSHYRKLKKGAAYFIYYFWADLLNLDLGSDLGQDHILKAALYWLKTFNIDGYRLDAAWAPMARNPDFMLEFRDRLKAEKPSMLLWAEDKAGRTQEYKNSSHPASSEVFDLVYDWKTEAEPISDWSWSRDEETVFNWDAKDNVGGEFRKSVLAYERSGSNKARVLRYLENNDAPRFIARHSLEQTKMAAALTFLLPGVPLIYYGQEIGYGTGEEVHDEFPTFANDVKMRDRDKKGLWPYYQKLTQLRSHVPELSHGTFKAVTLKPARLNKQVFAFERTLKKNKSEIFANLGSTAVAIERDGKSIPVSAHTVIVFRNGKKIFASDL